jgi:hypothetical protein
MVAGLAALPRLETLIIELQSVTPTLIEYARLT